MIILAGKKYTVGELAKLTGLTIRTLQHYDNIGIAPSSGRTEGGRRYYTEKDLMRLEQVVLYKHLGFSLEEISSKLIVRTGGDSQREILIEQELRLLKKMEHLHTAFAAVDAALCVIDAGREPSPHLLLQALRVLPSDDIWEKAPEALSDEEIDVFSRHFPDLDAAQRFYRRWKEITLATLALYHAGVGTEEPTAQELAGEWIALTQSVSGIDPDSFIALQNKGTDGGFAVNAEEIERAIRYLEEAVAIHEK